MRRRARLLAIALLFSAGWGAVGSPPSRAVAAPSALPAALPVRAYFPILLSAVNRDLAVSRVEVIQGITQDPVYTVRVAGRPALLRLFVALSGDGPVSGVTGRLTRFVGGVEQDHVDAGPITVQQTTYEGSLAQTLNFNLPAAWLSPGTDYTVQLDPNNQVAERDEGNNRYPAAGAQPFDFAAAPPLDVVIVPVNYARPGGVPTNPPVGNLAYLTWMPPKVLPLSQIGYTLHGAITFAGDLRTSDGWRGLLDQLTSLHDSEDPFQHKLYFGLVDIAAAGECSGGCIAGIGWVNSPGLGVEKTAVGFAGFPSDRNSASPTFTHEMGHNFGREHAPCPSSLSAGPYPYGSGAFIGQWGYDVSTGALYDPAVYHDYMSYCGPEWTSDFTYAGIFQAWSWVSQPFGAAAPQGPTEAIVLTGYRGSDGALRVEPLYREPAWPSVAAGPGRYQLELLDAAGQVLGTQSFDSRPVALDRTDSGDVAEGFRVALAPVAGLAGFRIFDGATLLYERFRTGPSPVLGLVPSFQAQAAGLDVAWHVSGGAAGAQYRVRFSPDGGKTWTMLALAMSQPLLNVPAQLLKGAADPLLEVQASDGVRTDIKLYAIPSR